VNIKFEYLYRDAANYKNWGDVIFRNASGSSINELDEKLRNALIDSEFFVAVDVDIPDLRFETHIDEFDHDWHVFHALQYTEEQPNDIQNRDIKEFVGCIVDSCSGVVCA
jgi:hypothetical protein